MDPIVQVIVANLVFPILYTFFKPQAWSKETRERVALGISLGLGAAIAYLNRTPGMDYLTLMSLAIATSQGFYRGIMEKFGVESVVRRVKAAITSGDHAELSGVEKVNVIYGEMKEGKIAKAEALARGEAVLADYRAHGVSLPDFLIQLFREA